MSNPITSNAAPAFQAINLACGGKLCRNEGWINADHNPSARDVMHVNLLGKLPFPDNSFDVIYHSQFIEHLSPDLGLAFMKECNRILKPQGVVRVVTPDLRNQALEYLHTLSNVIAKPDHESAKLRYQWIRLEMLDQLTRNTSGGEMVGFLNESGHRISDYLWERMGRSGKNLIPTGELNRREPSWKTLLRSIRDLARSIQLSLTPKSLRVGQFRLSGESHLCMYDEYSLSVLLEKASFQRITKVGALQSRIPDWNKTLLDCDEQTYPDGGTSLFMEATKLA